MENNHFDELLYSLPDYITGELDDGKIKEEIEAKLLVDSSFREEYDSLKSTMNFLQEAELEPPSEVYFANLQANILSKVRRGNPSEKQSILGRLVGYWKVVVPALTVCVVLVIYSQNMNSPQLPLTENKVQTTLTEKQDNKNHDTAGKDEVLAKENSSIDNTVTSGESEFNPKYKKQISISSNEILSSEDNSSYTDEPDGSILFGRDEETQAQDEYDNLSADDQLDILQSLKDKKL